MIVFNEVSKSFRIRNARSLKQTVLSLIGRQQLSDDFTAVRNLTFEVAPGESVAVMGRNGSGKSTTLKLLSGVLRPSEGWIRVRGRLAGLLEVGAGFHPDLTGRENVYLNASILGMSKAETDAKIDDIIEFAEIDDFIDTEVKRYSSGMYARLGFAVAIHTELDVLLVDEVLSVGDAAFRKKCNDKLLELQAQGKTMFIVSHSSGQVRKLCQRGIVLDHGRKIYDGPIDGAIEAMKPAEERILWQGNFGFRRVDTSTAELAALRVTESTRMEIPGSIGGARVLSIGASACADSALTHLRIPEPVERISQRAFLRSSELTTLDLPSTLRVIGPDAFRGCSSLSKLKLPDGLLEIGARAFQGCNSLEQIVLPRSIETIVPGAFAHCPNAIFICERGSFADRYLSARVPSERIHLLSL